MYGPASISSVAFVALFLHFYSFIFGLNTYDFKIYYDFCNLENFELKCKDIAKLNRRIGTIFSVFIRNLSSQNLPNVDVLSIFINGVWTTRYGSDRNVLNSILTNQIRFEILKFKNRSDEGFNKDSEVGYKLAFSWSCYLFIFI